jgi:hypothetical protein
MGSPGEGDDGNDSSEANPGQMLFASRNCPLKRKLRLADRKTIWISSTRRTFLPDLGYWAVSAGRVATSADMATKPFSGPAKPP